MDEHDDYNFHTIYLVVGRPGQLCDQEVNPVMALTLVGLASLDSEDEPYAMTCLYTTG